MRAALDAGETPSIFNNYLEIHTFTSANYDRDTEQQVKDLRSSSPDCSAVASTSSGSTGPLTVLGLAIIVNVIFMGFRLAANAGPPDAKKSPLPPGG